MQQPFLLSYLRLFHDSRLPVTRFSRLLKIAGRLGKALSDTAFLSAFNPNCDEQAAIHNALNDTGISDKVAADLKWQEQPGHCILCFEDSRYPTLLKQISCPPPLLYVDGDPDIFLLPQFAIVGSRKASHSGRQNALWLARELSEAGFSICSGLAKGIDSQAHRGALAGRGLTLAVLGTGIDRIYPEQHRELAASIRESGALLSEFPLGSLPLPGHFPQRNRIISGVSVGLLVAEATEQSGSLITARYALEQSREVFALPGPIFNPGSRGCHALLREGAKLVQSPEDILEELAPLVQAHLNSQGVAPAPGAAAENRRHLSPVNDSSKKVLAALHGDYCHPDSLQQQTGMDWPALQSSLLELELQGLIERRGGYVRLAD